MSSRVEKMFKVLNIEPSARKKSSAKRKIRFDENRRNVEQGVPRRKKPFLQVLRDVTNENFNPIVAEETQSWLLAPNDQARDLTESQLSAMKAKICDSLPALSETAINEFSDEYEEDIEIDYLSTKLDAHEQSILEIIVTEDDKTPEKEFLQKLLAVTPKADKNLNLLSTEERCQEPYNIVDNDGGSFWHPSDMFEFSKDEAEANNFDIASMNANTRKSDECVNEYFTPAVDKISDPTTSTDSSTASVNDIPPAAKKVSGLPSSAEPSARSLNHTQSAAGEISDDPVSVTPPSVKKQKKSNRTYDRTNYCLYCLTEVTNFTRHLLVRHPEEGDVIKYAELKEADAKIKLLTKDELKTANEEMKSKDENNKAIKKLYQKKKLEITNNLRNEGNYLFNSSSMDSTKFLPARRTNIAFTSTHKYLHCKYCKIMVTKKTFSRHVKKCSKAPVSEELLLNDTLAKAMESDEDGDLEFKDVSKCCLSTTLRKPIQKQAGLLVVPTLPEASKQLRNIIFPILQKDPLGLIAMNDSLILEMASMYFASHMEEKDYYNVTKKMRDAAKLVQKCRSDPDVKNFADIFKPSKFTLVTNVVQDLCGLDPDTRQVRVVGMPARLSYVLQEGARCLYDRAICNPNFSYEKRQMEKANIDDFQSQLKNKWKYIISTNAEKTRKKQKCFKTVKMPDDNDIKIMTAKIKKLEKVYHEILKKKITPKNYENVCQVTIAHAVTLNRRRSGEVARAALTCYLNRPSPDDLTEDALAQLNAEEKQSIDAVRVFMVPGKNGKTVPVLYTDMMEKNIELILECRKELGIIAENPEIPEEEKVKSKGNPELLFSRVYTQKPFSADGILRDLRKSCNLKKESHMTATGLRHHLGTKSQIQGNDNYRDKVAVFMGHTRPIHDQSYCFPLQAVQRGLIGKNLLRMEGEADTEPREENTEPCEVNQSNERIEQNDTVNTESENVIGETFENVGSFRENENILSPKVSRYQKGLSKPGNKGKNSVPWTAEEKELVISNFTWCLKKKTRPGIEMCLDLIKKYPILSKRTPHAINAQVDNFIKGKTKLPPKYASLLREETDSDSA